MFGFFTKKNFRAYMQVREYDSLSRLFNDIGKLSKYFIFTI